MWMSAFFEFFHIAPRQLIDSCIRQKINLLPVEIIIISALRVWEKLGPHWGSLEHTSFFASSVASSTAAMTLLRGPNRLTLLGWAGLGWGLFTIKLLQLTVPISGLNVPLPPLKLPPTLSSWQQKSIDYINDQTNCQTDGQTVRVPNDQTNDTNDTNDQTNAKSPFTLLTTAPTGTGKTLIAHHFIHSLLTSNPDSRCIYCTPLKALSNQKYKEACEVFKEENVGLITGDTKVKTTPDTRRQTHDARHTTPDTLTKNKNV